MRARALRLSVGIVVFVAACTMDAGMSDPSPTASSPTVRYVALGDSYTIGTGVQETERWPNQLVDRLRHRVPLELVANLGVNGYTTSDVIGREMPPLEDLRPDFVTLLIGVNDVVRGVPRGTFERNLDEILGGILRHVDTDRVVIVSIPDYTRTPRGADFGDPAQQRDAIREFNDILRLAAQRRDFAFVDIGGVADEAGGDPTLVATDGLHPSGAQYSRWVDLIAPVVEELLAAS